jgi:flagellar hook-associated protein 3 FlgL
MPLRVSESQLYLRAIRDNNLARQRLRDATLPLTTQQKISQPSDDPVTAARLNRLRRARGETEQFQEVVEQVRTYHSLVESTLDSISSVVVDLTDLAVQMGSDGVAAVDRTAAVDLVQQWTNSLKMMGNQKQAGRYLFAGRRQGAPPYDANFLFVGDEAGRRVSVGESRLLDADVTGTEIFGGGTTGVKSLFKIAEDFIAALQANDSAGISTVLGELRGAHDRVIGTHVRVGIILNDIETVNYAHDNRYIAQTIHESDVIGVDFARATHELAFSQSVLEATIITTQRLFDAINIRNFNL